MKKVLFITTSFYPDPYVGSVRTKEFCRWLPEFGWKPYVLTKDYGHRVSETEFVSAVNQETEVRYLNKFDAGAISTGTGAKGLKAKVISFLGKYVLAPDVSVLFWRKQTQNILNLVDEINPDVVITTGPPHSIHLVGIAVKKHRPDVAWIADFRDEFSNGKGYKRSFLTLMSDVYSWRFEKSVYQHADGLVFAIPTHYRWLRSKVSGCATKTKLILNGAPVELKPKEAPDCRNEKNNSTITVIGFNNAPESLLLAKAVARLKADCRLKFVGSIPPYSEQIKRVLGRRVVFTGGLPHSVVMDELQKADVLVGILSQERSRRIGISSKMFEYLVMPVPVLLLNPTRPDRSLFSNLSGVFLGFDVTENKIYELLERALSQNTSDCIERAVRCYSIWNRNEQALKLSEFMGEVCFRGSE